MRIGDRPPDTTEQEKNLARASAGKSSSTPRRKRLAATKHWLIVLPEEIRQFEAPARLLKDVVESDLPKVAGLLERQIAALEAYAATTTAPVPKAGKETRSISDGEPSPVRGRFVPKPAPYGARLAQLFRRLLHRQHLHADMRRILRRTIDTLSRRLEVAVAGLEYVRHIFLRVAIDQRKPGALHLHHDLVPLAKTVMTPVQIDRVFVDLIGNDRFGFRKTLAKTGPHRLAADEQLVAAQMVLSFMYSSG